MASHKECIGPSVGSFLPHLRAQEAGAVVEKEIKNDHEDDERKELRDGMQWTRHFTA